MITLNAFLSSGTNAERLAYTPTPATPAAGPDPTCIFAETDTGNGFFWDFDGAAWAPAWVSGTGGAFTAAGTLDPNGAITGSPGDQFKSAISLGGDGSLWVKVSGVGTNTGWE